MPGIRGGLLVLAIHAAALPGDAVTERPNVVLISIDTLRADRLGCYGYGGAQTPAIDALASSGVLFENAYAQVPMTRPSHASILTGLYPFEHRIRDNFSLPLAGGIPTLATVLKGAGYTTAGFPGSVLLSSQSGLQRGFDYYLDNFAPGKQTNPEFFSSFQKNAESVSAAAIKWVEENHARPFFLFVHFYDPHTEYSAPEPYRSRFAQRPYDGEVAYTDEHVGRLLGTFERLSLRQRTLVVLCSDHGEGLGQHGEEEHLFFVYNSTLHIPLIFSWPGHVGAGLRSRPQARAIDIMPTLLKLVGIEAPARLSGIDVGQALKGGSPPSPPSYAETLFPRLHFGWSDLRSVTDGSWKLIRAPRPELYDIGADPAETKNLYSSRKEDALRLSALLDSIYVGRDDDAPQRAEAADAAELEALAQLGYVGSSTTDVVKPGADPKDKIAEFQGFNHDLRVAIEAFSAGDNQKSADMLQSLITRGKSSFEVQYFLGRALFRLGRVAEAIERLKEGISKLPAFAPIYTELARAYVAQNRIQDAVALMQQCILRDDTNATFHAYMGFLRKIGRAPEEAAREYERARALAPTDVEIREALAAVYRDAGRLDAAERELREAVRIDPASDSAWNSLGMILGSVGRDEEARMCFEEAMRIDSGDPYYHFNLARMLERSAKIDDARREYAEALRLKPDFAEARHELESLPTQTPALIRFRLIRIKQKAVADAVARKIAAGDSFEALARNYSIDPSRPQGGLYEVADLRELKPAIAAALALLKVGQTSPMVVDGEHFVIVHLVSMP
ncbi:MAG: sulfatase-like hydrolase/transferase [Acidobacteria bacterium]|nr:sulfatase-like hydrolase/transferase [Acidobacteriota bacterium]